MASDASGPLHFGDNARVVGDVFTGGKHTAYHLPDQPLELSGSRLPPRNALFVGRDDSLAALAERLAAPSSLAVLAGPGGMGKSQTAIEFAYRHGALFPGGCFWLRCQQPELIAAEIAACGRQGRLAFPEYDALPQPEQVALVQRAWAQSIPRLLILDNAEDPRLVQAWLPTAGGCRALVTARRSKWPPALTPNVLTLPALEHGPGLDLLAQSDPARAAAYASDPAASELIDLLGGLPLALHCAGAYLAYYAQTPAEYLAELSAHASALAHESLGDWLEQHEALPTGHSPNVTATFDLSYGMLLPAAGAAAPPRQDLARRLFHLLAHCAPAVPVPREVLALAAAQADPKRLAAALHELSDLGLVTLDSELRPAIHRLVQAYAGQKAPDAEADLLDLEVAVAKRAAEQYASGLPAEMRPLLPHLQSLAQQAVARQRESASELLNQLGRYQVLVADYAAARVSFEQALALDERAFGAAHPGLAARVGNLGGVLFYQGDLAGAQAAFERALDLDEQARGPDHPLVATDINNLGRVLRERGDLAGARAAFERALSIDERALGAGHAKVAADAGSLGLVLLALGDLSGARSAFERALAIDERVQGPRHPDVARDINNLGRLLHIQGDLAGARAAFERSLSIHESVFGRDHPEVAGVVNNLATVLRDWGDLAGARAAFERALAIDERVYGPQHAQVATVVNNLGLVLHDLGDLAGARAAFERALSIEERARGPDHLAVATSVNNLAGLLQELGDLSGARAAFERALAIDERELGPYHPSVAQVVNNLGLVLQDLGDLAGARAAFERSLAILTQAYGPEHPAVAVGLNNVGLALRALGDRMGARAALERSLAITEQIFGPDHIEIAATANNLGLELEDAGDLAGARAAFARSLSILERHTPDHPNTLVARKHLSAVDQALAAQAVTDTPAHDL